MHRQYTIVIKASIKMKKSTFVAMILGTISGVLFALGKCMALISEWNAFTPRRCHGCGRHTRGPGRRDRLAQDGGQTVGSTERKNLCDDRTGHCRRVGYGCWHVYGDGMEYAGFRSDHRVDWHHCSVGADSAVQGSEIRELKIE